MKKKIHWESIQKEIPPIENYMYDPTCDLDDEDFSESDTREDIVRAMSGRDIVSTPFGDWPCDDWLNPYRQFHFWLANTNFQLTPNIAKQIADIDGVEVLHVYSRYKFIIACGILFDEKMVKLKIQDVLCGIEIESDHIDSIDNIKIKKDVEILCNELRLNSGVWAVYVLPDGKCIKCEAPSLSEEFKLQLDELRTARQMSGGVLICELQTLQTKNTSII